MQPSFFENFTSKQQSPNSQNKVTEEKIIQPLTQVLEVVTPNPVSQQSQSVKKYQPIKQSLDELFPEQQYDEKNIKKAKEILGSLGNDFTDIQLRSVITEIQYLTESWLDNFERKIFDSLTLQELLHEKGGST